MNDANPKARRMADMVSDFDWGSTPLGPIGDWPQSLKTAIDVVLGSGHAMMLAWGPKRTLLYNDAYAPMLGNRHPAALGMPFAEAWPDIWTDIEPLVSRVFEGETVRFEDLPLTMTRNGYPEETWWNFSYSPLRDETGAIAGLLNVTVDASPKVRADRAEKALRESELRLRQATEAARAGTWTLMVETGEFEASDRAMELHGLLPGTPITHDIALSRVHPDDRRMIAAALLKTIESGEPFRVELRALQADGSIRRLVSQAERQTGDGKICLVGLVQDVTEQKQAEAALRDSERRLRHVLDGMDEACGLMDRDFRILMQNDAALRLDGRPLSEIVGRTHWEVYPGSENTEVGRLYKRAVAGQAPVSLEHRYTFPGGATNWLEMRAFPVPEGLAVFWRDITERKEAEAALRESEGKYRGLFQTMDEGYVLAELIFDAEGRPVDALYLEGNPAATRLTGVPDFSRRLLSDAMPNAEPYWMEIYERVMRSREPVRLERYAGDLGRWYDFSIFPVEASASDPADPVRLAILFTDVTERRQAEEGLRQSQERQAFLLELSDALAPLAEPAAIMGEATRLLGKRLDAGWCYYNEFDDDGTVAVVLRDFVRPGLPRMVGRHDVSAIQEFIRLIGTDKSFNIPDIAASPHLPPDFVDRYMASGVRSALGVPLVKDGNLIAVFVAADSRAREWNEAETTLLRDVAERTWAAVERARAEAASRESEERLRVALSISTVGVLFWQGNGELEDANDAFLEMSGFGREEALGRTWQDFTPPEFHEVSQAFVDEVQRTGEGKPYEKQYFRKDGSRFWGIFTARVFGRGFVEFVIDTTRQHEAQEDLRRSEERLRQFGEASQDVLWIRDAQTMQWTYLTPAFETIYGLAREEALSENNYRNWMELIVPEDRERVADEIGRIRAGEHVTFEYRIRRPSDGEIRWLRNTDFPITGADGAITMVGGIGQDVTEAKRAGERIEQSEERLRSAVEVGRLGLWDWNVVTGEIHWSDEHFRMEGYQVGEVKPSYATWASRIHPDDRAETERSLRRAMEEKTEYVREFRVVHPDNSVHWLYGRGRFFYDENGLPLRMIGALIDITDRREWEERQRVLIAELQHSTRNLMGVIRSVSEKTVRSSADLDDFSERFRDRLDALARVQGLLSRLNEHDRVTFDELLDSELSAMAGASERVELRGPDGVRLRSSSVQTLALALHELATNAVKYGALGQTGGHLAINWRLQAAEDGDPWLHIDWRESGVDTAGKDAGTGRTGEGRELIERALPYQLGARTSWSHGPDGVHCTIALPLSPST